jgi:hypothetical protein
MVLLYQQQRAVRDRAATSAQSESDIDRNSSRLFPNECSDMWTIDTGDDDENTESFDANANEVDRIVYGSFSGGLIGGHSGLKAGVGNWIGALVALCG